MDRTFSTFEIVKIIPDLNRNTFQSALAAGFVVPDIRRADGPGERSAFSLDGVYNVALFFRLVSIGLGRKRAAGLLRNLEMTWENVGEGRDHFKHLEITVMDPKHLKPYADGEELRRELSPAKEGELFRWTVALLPIKRTVDAGIEQL
jgi:hypothetical protein